MGVWYENIPRLYFWVYCYLCLCLAAVSVSEMGRGIQAFYCEILTFYVGVNYGVLETYGCTYSALDNTQTHDCSTSNMCSASLLAVILLNHNS
jgi:hypothetical protein